MTLGKKRKQQVQYMEEEHSRVEAGFNDSRKEEKTASNTPEFAQ